MKLIKQILLPIIFLVSCTPEDIYDAELLCEVNQTREISIRHNYPFVASLEYTNSLNNFEFKPTGLFIKPNEKLVYIATSDTNYFRLKGFDSVLNATIYSSMHQIILKPCETKAINISMMQLLPKQ